MNQYDDYFSMVSNVLAKAELNQEDPQKALQRVLIESFVERLDDREGKNNIDQLIGCSLEQIERKGNKFIDWFMDSSRLDYRDYPEEVKKLINSFETQTEMIVFFVQILNMIRYKRSQEVRNNPRWNDLLKGI